MRAWFLLLCAVSLIWAGRKSDIADSVITVTKEQLKAKEYSVAEASAKEFIEEYGKAPENEQVVPLLLEAFIQQNKFAQFDRLMSKYLKKFPESTELGRIYYLEGIGHAKQREYNDAFSAFNRAMTLSTDNEKRIGVIRKNCEKIMKHYLTAKELSSIDVTTISPLLQEAHAFYLGVRTKEDDEEKATELLTAFLAKYPKTEFDTSLVLHLDMDEVVKKKSRVKGDKNLIALMVPMSGNNKMLGELTVNAVELALADYIAKSGDTLKLEVVDTKGSPVVTAKATRSLIDRGVQTIIGPIMSNTATVTAAMLIEHPEIVMVTPTATDDGIAALGTNVYQINITPKAVADMVATYAVQQLKISQFTILAPLTDYGRQVGDYFADKVKELGATVEVHEYFAPTANDHRNQFDKIKEHYWRQLANIPDSVEMLSSFQVKRMDDYFEESTINIGGLFVPSSADNAVKIAAEVPFHKVRAQLLGANGWDNNTLILDGQKYVKDAIFGAGYTAEEKSIAWLDFKKRYVAKFQRDPNKMVSPLAYDAAMITFKALEGSRSGKDVLRKLSSVSEYPGLSGIISLNNQEGANSGIVIKKVSGKQFIKLQ